MAIISDSKINAHPLRLQIQKLFQKDLAWENDYLRQENRILRSKFEKRIPLTDADRRTLVKYGMRIRDRLADVTSIVKPETILAWNRRMKKRKWTYDNTPKKPGRPRKSAETDVLILRLAEENATWGYWRIAGELKKLGHVASKSHVRDVLKRHGICQMRMTAGGYHGAQPTSVARTMISNNCSAWSGVPPPHRVSVYASLKTFPGVWRLCA